MTKPFTPVPKPVSSKTKNKNMKPNKTVDMAAVEAKKSRREQNNINRNFGKSIERNVAKIVGGTRVPMSGAIKNSVHNLEGDVRVMTPDGKRTMLLIECKGSSGVTPKGDKTHTMNYSVLKQFRDEGRQQHAIPLLWYHWKDNDYMDDYVLIPSKEFLQILEDLRTLYTIEYLTEDKDER